ncbi:receptor-type tyrosine-protein phosphatase kappa-like [Heptranchias perlo]|uniref:receptor-type tyrosine-protein phosphatase kappa-like n=1 Tax=Heptranchias perlo TaxID=212740 RepID=UPI00355AACAD
MTQLPLAETLADFWALIYDYSCVSLVTMNQPKDLDQTYMAFWPQCGSASYGPFQVKLVSEKLEPGFSVRHLRLKNLNQKTQRDIKMLQLDNWPMGTPVPQSPDTIIRILQEVETWQKNIDKPVLVSCWDGASRSGLFCAASIVCEQIRREGLVDVFQAAKTTRSSRPQVIATAAQYTFCYELAETYLHMQTPNYRETNERPH